MARSLKKGPYIEPKLEIKARKAQQSSDKQVIKTWSRRSTILTQFVGITYNVYNGKKFIPVLVSEEIVGPKLGEYSTTRTYYGHTADKKVKK